MVETLRYVLLVNGLLAVVSVAYYALLRRETFFNVNRLVLWLGVAGSLLLPLLDLPDWRPQPIRSAMQRTARAIVPNVLAKPVFPQPDVTITFPDLKTYRAFQVQQNRFVWSWQPGLLLLYVIGVLLLLIRLLGQLLSLRKLIRQSVPEPYTDFTLVQNKIITSPFSFFNWVFINPDQHTPDELDQILRHERVHVRERHSVDMLAVEFVCIVLWFNPAAYLFRYLLHQILEFRADRAVLAEGIDARAYQYNLVKVSLSARQSVVTTRFSGPTLRQRVSMINSQPSRPRAWWRYALWVCSMGIVVLACQHETRQHARIPYDVLAGNALPATSPARVMVIDLEEKGTWYRHMALYQDKFSTQLVESKPVILQLKGDQFILPDDYTYESALYINGKAASVNELARLSPEFVRELFVMHQWENLADADKHIH